MDLQTAFAEFVLDRRARQLRPSTIRWYQTHLTALVQFLREQGIALQVRVLCGSLPGSEKPYGGVKVHTV